MKSLVIALGGNALMSPFGGQSFSNENENIEKVSREIAKICKCRDYNIVITYGNGSQVGAELMRNEHSKKYVPKLPLYILNAETQGLIGTVIETSMRNSLNKLKVNRRVCVVLAHVLVDKNDPSFKRPSKPIGTFYTENELHAELNLDKFSYIKTSAGYRMVVASPMPKSILEIDTIMAETDKCVLITCGGGGIPIVKDGLSISGVDAVIDKDLTSQLLANSLGAEKLIILTDADYIYDDYAKRKGHIKEIRAKELKKMLKKFEEGSIRPKVEACIRFIENGGKDAYIGNVFKLNLILKGKSGTRVY
jgi:carbamate kinase